MSKPRDLGTSAELDQRFANMEKLHSTLRSQYRWARNAGHTPDRGEQSDVRRPIHESDPTRSLVITETEDGVRLNRRKESERENVKQGVANIREAERRLQSAAACFAAVVGEPVEVQQGKPGMDDDAWRGYVSAQQRRISRGEGV